jgi:hypothetical protein
MDVRSGTRHLPKVLLASQGMSETTRSPGGLQVLQGNAKPRAPSTHEDEHLAIYRSNPEAVSWIRIQSYYQVGPGMPVGSRWLPDLSTGRPQQCLDEVKLFSRSLGESHQKTLKSVIEEVALFYRKRIRIRQQRIASLAHQVLGAEADAWLNKSDYQGLPRLERLDHSHEFEEALGQLSALKAPKRPAKLIRSRSGRAAPGTPPHSSHG